jgi:hypothetical protein
MLKAEKTWGITWKQAEARGSMHINAYRQLIRYIEAYYKTLLGLEGGVEVSPRKACCCQKYIKKI